MGPMRASEDGDERDMTSIIKAAHEKQKVARENVDKKADAEAANKQTHEMNMQLANAGVVPPVAPPVVAAVVAPVQQLPNATVVPPAQAPPNTTEAAEAVEEAAEAEIASTPGADELSQSIEAEAAEAGIASTLAVDAVDAAPKVEETAPEVEETAPEVEQEAAAAE